MKKEQMRRKPHNHSNNAMSKFGSIFLNRNVEGNRTLMCLECKTTWSIPDGIAPAGYWLCPHGCNEIFKTGFTCEDDAKLALTHILDLFQPWDQGYMLDCVIGLNDILNSDTYAGSDWRWLLYDNLIDCVENCAKFNSGCFGTELAFNTIRHYVAHLADWFAGWEAEEAKGARQNPTNALDVDAHHAEYNMVLDQIDTFEPTNEFDKRLKAFFVECRNRRDEAQSVIPQ